MKLCGIKLTHDGSVSLLEDDRLMFNVELEKVNINPRYSMIEDTTIIETILNTQGYDLSEVNHFVNDNWIEKIPVVIYIDNTARLQTVNEKQNLTIYNLLSEYYRLSGVPLLSNTSANYNGTCFFPDVYSATKWNKTNFVWSDNTFFL